MPLRKLSSTNAFVVLDLDGAERHVGVARVAPKVLQDGAWTLARTVTYAYATFGVRAGGASAGINAGPDERDAAVAAFCAEVGGMAPDLGLSLTASTGLEPSDLAPLGGEPVDDELAARGVLAATTAFAGGPLEGRRVAIAGRHPAVATSRNALEAAGAALVDGERFDADAEVLLVAGKVGVVDHHVAESVRAPLLVPLTPVPVTARAYAELARRGTTYLPDTVALAAPLLHLAEPTGGDPVERVAGVAAELAATGVAAWREAVERAETFLRTWRDELPFGRPLA